MKRAKTLVLVGISFAGIVYGQTRSQAGSGVNDSSPSISMSEEQRRNSCINPINPASDSNADGLQTIASDWTMRAMLTRPVDVKKNKPGDPVTARTMQSSKTLDGRTMPKGTELVGHVTQAQPRSEGQSYSELGIVFDKTILKDGQELLLISPARENQASNLGHRPNSRGDSSEG